MDNQKASRPSREAVEGALQQLMTSQQAVSRDHTATMDDQSMKEIMAKSWRAWDQWLNQLQRDMSRFPATDQDDKNLNMMMFCLSQIINRSMEAVTEGELSWQKKQQK